MFSLQKLVVLAAVLAAVWYGFKFIGRLDKARRVKAKAALLAAEKGEAVANAQDMERCAACGDFVAAQVSTSCGRDDCPYPG